VETWSQEKIELKGRFTKYKLFDEVAIKQNIKGRASGGLAVLINPKKFQILHYTSNPNFQILTVKLVKTSEQFIITNTYIQPLNEKDCVLSDFFDLLDSVCNSNPNASVICCGDFNSRTGSKGIVNPIAPSYISQKRKSQDTGEQKRATIIGTGGGTRVVIFKWNSYLR
jgi:hypothetical protein